MQARQNKSVISYLSKRTNLTVTALKRPDDKKEVTRTFTMVAYMVPVVIVMIALAWYYMSSPGVIYDRSILSDDVADVYDYIIVGGGSAGSVVASRLSEDEDKKILLLEAGGFYDENDDFHVPIKWMKLGSTKHDWAYVTEPQTDSCWGFNNRQSNWPRGKVLGGSSVLNAHQYTRGSPFEYDEWERNGCTGWSYNDVLPYFKKSENIQIDDLWNSIYHGTEGPIAVSGSSVTYLQDMYMQAGQELGYKVNDYNGESQEGFSRIQTTVRKGVRSSTGLEFLGRVGKRPNLDISINTFVTKLAVDGNRAYGLYYIKDHRQRYVKARKEIILSAGAINTPQLLMLSGIGPRQHLEDLAIPVVRDLPVGENLQDHQQVVMISKINKPYSITDEVLNSWWTRQKYAWFGTGPLATAGCEGSAFFYIDESLRGNYSAQIQFIICSTYTHKGQAKYFNFNTTLLKNYLGKAGNVHGISTLVSVAHPRSRGVIRLRSTDAFEYPILDPKYLSDKRDVDDFIAGIRIWEKFIKTPTMQSLGVDMNKMKLGACFQHLFQSDAYWKCFVRHVAMTANHVSGTCKMGAASDTTAVVDPELKVRGIEGLRVVDASILPNITAGNINAPVIMAAEKLSDMIRGKDTVQHLRIDD